MDQIIGLIQSGGLETGAKLPSTRVFAKRHQINRSTVYKAYQELWALGYLECRPGSYSFVRNRTPLHSKGDSESSDTLNWEKKTTPAAQKCLDRYERLSHAMKLKKELKDWEIH
jgi:GntR family transcriptional regulator/MocR family aminotransferase